MYTLFRYIGLGCQKSSFSNTCQIVQCKVTICRWCLCKTNTADANCNFNIFLIMNWAKKGKIAKKKQ